MILKIAGVQMDVELANVNANIERVRHWFREARDNDADLVVFPECALTGYCFESRAQALEFAERIPGPRVDELVAMCREWGGEMIVGLLEGDGDALYNAACHVGADGVVASYRKVHLPYLGVDRFADFGDRPFVVYESQSVRMGINICYDSGFPEASRVLALAGADVVILPTNWPTGAENLAEHAIATRALENAIYYVAINRVGEEQGFRFIGNSRICDPAGNILAAGSDASEEVLYATIDPSKARRKTIVRVPGKHLIDRMKDRRPECYGALVTPQDEPRPGRDIPASEFT